MAEGIADLRRRGRVRSDWKADKMTLAEIEAAIATDPDETGMVVNWENATVGLARR